MQNKCFIYELFVAQFSLCTQKVAFHKAANQKVHIPTNSQPLLPSSYFQIKRIQFGNDNNHEIDESKNVYTSTFLEEYNEPTIKCFEYHKIIRYSVGFYFYFFHQNSVTNMNTRIVFPRGSYGNNPNSIIFVIPGDFATGILSRDTVYIIIVIVLSAGH